MKLQTYLIKWIDSPFWIKSFTSLMNRIKKRIITKSLLNSCSCRHYSNAKMGAKRRFFKHLIRLICKFILLNKMLNAIICGNIVFILTWTLFDKIDVYFRAKKNLWITIILLLFVFKNKRENKINGIEFTLKKKKKLKKCDRLIAIDSVASNDRT